MKKLIFPLLTAALLGGCSSFPENYEKPLAEESVTTELNDRWSSIPALSYLPSRAGIVVRKHMDLPAVLQSQPIRLEVSQGTSLSLNDLVRVLKTQGIQVASALKASGELELMNSRYDGTLGALLGLLSVTHNIAYEYRNGVLFLTESSRYSVTLPQHKEYLEEVGKGLISMGAERVLVDVRAGAIFYYAKPDVASYLEDYIGDIAKNSAMVKLQVAVISVRLNRDVSLGFDWSKLGVTVGTKGFEPGRTTDPAQVTQGAGAVSGVVGSVASTTAKQGSLVGFSGDGFVAKFATNTFSLSAAINALSTYGTARTEQNVILGTLSGLPVKIKSGNDIPYVKSVGASTTAGGAVSGSTETGVIESGLQLEVMPYFDASDSAVVTTVKVDMSSLVGFRELSAGANLGTLSQPELQTLTFENVGRLAAGETVIMGGITFDQLNESYTSFPGAERAPVGSKSDKINRYALYIIVRPTVVMFAADPGTSPLTFPQGAKR